MENVIIKLVSSLTFLAQKPLLAVTLFALVLPMVILNSAPKFVLAPVENLVVFCCLFAISVVYSAGIVLIFKNKVTSKEKD